MQKHGFHFQMTSFSVGRIFILGLFLMPWSSTTAQANDNCSSGAATSKMSPDEIANCHIDAGAVKLADSGKLAAGGSTALTSSAGTATATGSTSSGRAPGGQDTTATTGTGTSSQSRPQTDSAGGNSTLGGTTSSADNGTTSSVSGRGQNTTGSDPRPFATKATK